MTNLPSTATPGPDAPAPTKVWLPIRGDVPMYTREQLQLLYRCSRYELTRLLLRKQAPLPIRHDGQILWYVDEACNAAAQAVRTLERWRKK